MTDLRFYVSWIRCSDLTSAKDFPLISVVIPVKNGGRLVSQCLKSLKHLNYPPRKLEIILADGRSTDQTRLIASKLGAKVIDNPAGTVVSGRNIGFAAAKGDLIAFTDIDCTFSKNWLKNSRKYFSDSRVGAVSGPNLIPTAEKPFSRAVGLIFDLAYLFGVGAPTKKYRYPIESRSHGSNIIFRCLVLKKIFPLDESLVEGEDVLMTEKATRLGYQLLYVPDVAVYHFRRATPGKWFNQMVRYAQAKVLLERKGIKKATLLQKIVGFLLVPLVLLFLLVPLMPLVPLILLVLFVPLFLFPIFFYGLFSSRSLAVSFSLLYAFIIMIFAWSLGFLKETILASGRKWDYQ